MTRSNIAYGLTGFFLLFLIIGVYKANTDTKITPEQIMVQFDVGDCILENNVGSWHSQDLALRVSAIDFTVNILRLDTMNKSISWDKPFWYVELNYRKIECPK